MVGCDYAKLVFLDQGSLFFIAAGIEGLKVITLRPF